MENKILTAKEYKAQIEKHGEIAFVPRGNSMWPFIKNKAQTVIIQKKTVRLNKFDVGFYSYGENAVLHRVVEVLDDGYVFCGDSQFVLQTVKEEDVFGKMTYFYQGDKCVNADDKKVLKKVKKWYKHPLWRKIRIKLFYLFKR